MSAEKRKIVLVVDDDKFISALVKDRLVDSGYDVVTAGDGEEALEKAAALLPDLITLDINMPMMNGDEVLKKLKEKGTTQHIPVIILTVKSDHATEDKVLKLGAEVFMGKPFHPAELAGKVMRLLNG